MKDEYLSIAEFAKRAGVARQTVYRKLSQELQPYVTDGDNGKAINIKALELFGVTDGDKDVTATVTDMFAYLDGQLKRFDRLIDVLENDNEKMHGKMDFMSAQLEEKDRQIAAKDRQIADLSRLADQAQLLTDQSQKLNSQAHGLLAASRRDPDPSPVDLDEVDAAYKKGRAEELKEIKRAFVELDKKYPEAARYFVAMLQSTSPRT